MRKKRKNSATSPHPETLTCNTLPPSVYTDIHTSPFPFCRQSFLWFICHPPPSTVLTSLLPDSMSMRTRLPFGISYSTKTRSYSTWFFASSFLVGTLPGQEGRKSEAWLCHVLPTRSPAESIHFLPSSLLLQTMLQ